MYRRADIDKVMGNRIINTVTRYFLQSLVRSFVPGRTMLLSTSLTIHLTRTEKKIYQTVSKIPSSRSRICLEHFRRDI